MKSRRLVLVVGGGGAADFVRDLDAVHSLGETVSHALALRALDLTAHSVAAMIPGLKVVERPEELSMSWESGWIPVLAPRWFVENLDSRSDDPLSLSWSVTTDSIAARVARYLGSPELRLLKSRGLGNSTSRHAAARSGVVDPEFTKVSRQVPSVVVVNLRADPPTTDPMH